MIWNLIGSIGGKVLDIVDDVVEDKDEADDPSARTLSDTLDSWHQSKDLVAAMPDPGMVAYDFMKLTGLLAFSVSWSRLEVASDQADDPAHIRRLANYVRGRMLPEAKFYFHRIKANPMM